MDKERHKEVAATTQGGLWQRDQNRVLGEYLNIRKEFVWTRRIVLNEWESKGGGEGLDKCTKTRPSQG